MKVGLIASRVDSGQKRLVDYSQWYNRYDAQLNQGLCYEYSR